MQLLVTEDLNFKVMNKIKNCIAKFGKWDMHSIVEAYGNDSMKYVRY